MEPDDDERRLEHDVELAAELLAGCPWPGDFIEPGVARDGDSPRLFTHPHQAVGMLRHRDEVQVRELGQCVSHDVVDRAAGDVSAGDVGHGDQERDRGCRDSEQLEPVPDHHQRVRTPALEAGGEALRR